MTEVDSDSDSGPGPGDLHRDLYRDLYDGAACGQLSTDGHGVVIRVNQTLLDWLGREPLQLLGQTFTSLLPAGDQIFYETRYLPVLRLQGEVREVAVSLRTRAGALLAVVLNARAIRADTGALTEITFAVFDSTERQGYERQLLAARRIAESTETRVGVLLAASTAFGASGSETELAQALADAARRAAAASATAVMLLDAAGGAQFVAGEHPLAEFAASDEAREALSALCEAGIVTIPDVAEIHANYPGLARAMTAARIASLSVVPIEDLSGPVGTLMCFFQRTRAFPDADIALQLALTRQAAQVIARLRLQEELTQLTLHDQLTGLANRKLLREQLIPAMASTVRRSTAISLILVDLDGFKSINDRLGHQRGDDMLIWAASQLTDAVRALDLVCRFGGDEFVIICEDADERAAREIAERVRAALRGSEHGLDVAELSASIGVAVCVGDRATMRPEDLFAAADAAMYESKRAGKNRVTVTLA